MPAKEKRQKRNLAAFGRTISKHRQLLDVAHPYSIIKHIDIRSIISDVGFMGANVEGDANDVYE